MVRKIKKSYHISTSISLMDGANLVNIFSRIGDKIITSIRIQMSRSRFGTIWKKWGNILLMRMIGFFSYRIVSVSEGVRQDLIHNFGLPEEQVVTIYNFCDIEFIQQISKDNTIPSLGINSIITMGRLTEQKGQWHLIRAISEVIKDIPEVNLYILGDGPLRNQLGKLVTDLNLTKHVVFLGFKKNPYNYLSLSDIFVLPSLFEGCPNVLIESMACGAACISADCPSGAREILAPDTTISTVCKDVEYAKYGILIPVDNSIEFDAHTPLTKSEKLLSKAIIRLLTDINLKNYYKTQAFKRSLDFSPQTITKYWEELM